jgi:restriction system protein
MDITFHYPPELMNLLVDTIPRLNRSKRDVFLFFQGAGISKTLMQPALHEWERDSSSVNKFDIVRQILTNLNQRGEGALRERREVLRRVVEFDDFSTCWANDALEAKGLVGEIRRVVDVKDSFTRMSQERANERQERMAAKDTEAQALAKRRSQLDGIKKDLFALVAEANRHRRGKALEGVLNRLFDAHGILIREAFTLRGDDKEGVVEQIDGVVELEGHVYFVEMKWWIDPVGVPQISEHMMRVFLRAEARAIIVSASGFTAPAVATCKEALSQKVVALCSLQEIVVVLERQLDLSRFLKSKVYAAMTHKNPFFEPIAAGEM